MHLPSEKLLIHSTILLKVYCEPGNISRAGNLILNKTDKISGFVDVLHFSRRRWNLSKR